MSLLRYFNFGSGREFTAITPPIAEANRPSLYFLLILF